MMPATLHNDGKQQLIASLGHMPTVPICLTILKLITITLFLKKIIISK